MKSRERNSKFNFRNYIEALTELKLIRVLSFVLFVSTVANAAPGSREERIGVVPKGSAIATTLSADGRHRLELMRGAGVQYVVFDGRPDTVFARIEEGTIVTAAGGRYAYIAYLGEQPVMMIDGAHQPGFQVMGAPEFSPDGKHVAYVAQTRDSIFVVRDGVPGPGISAATTRGLVLSPDTRRTALVAVTGSRPHVVVDGVAGPETEGIADGSLAFSPGSQRCLYVVQSGTQWALVIDGRRGPLVSGIAPGTIAFSADDRHVAYVAQREGKSCVVLDDQPGPAFDEIAQGPPTFSPDGKRLMYLARRGSAQYVVVDGRTGAAFDEIPPASLRFSPDSRRFAHAGRQGEKWRVVVDGKAGAAVENLATGSPRFGPDGRVAWAGYVDGAWKVTVEDRAGPAFDGLEEASLVVGPGNGRIAYVVRRGHSAHTVIDGVVGPAFDLVVDPVLSPDGQRVAYLGQTRDSTTLMVGDRAVAREPWSGQGGPVFSRDGRRVAYLAKRGSQWFTVVDGTPGPAFDTIHSGTLVATGTGFEYLAARAGSLYRVMVE